ncbi:MAG TPA: glutamate 5-kinase, partial [Candidatus Nanoarchaeia archaeon]|nr:glutamate 5-kinase [Candidatus Nanoarchaeia archaeon]
MIVFLARKELKNTKRIVIKLGTNIVINQNGRFNSKLITSLLKEISSLKDSGKSFILVSSGAIGLGNNSLNWKKAKDTLLNQCSASVGQSLLMHEYRSCSNPLGIAIAQVLLTREDLKSSKRKERIKNLIEKLTGLNVLAIINENDSVSTEEITFGDNDILSAHIAQLFNADLLDR